MEEKWNSLKESLSMDNLKEAFDMDRVKESMKERGERFKEAMKPENLKKTASDVKDVTIRGMEKAKDLSLVAAAKMKETFDPEKMKENFSPEKIKEAFDPEKMKERLKKLQEMKVTEVIPFAGKKKTSVLETLSDIRIDKCVKRLQYSDDELQTMYIIFNNYDKEGLGYITTDDLLVKLLQEERTAFSDAILGLIDTKNSEVVTFGEYIDLISMFCLFEEDDMLKLAFKMFDPTKSGFVDKDELRFFIYSQHNDDQSSNIERGLKYLEDNDDGDGRFEFYQIKDMHKNFQALFYPCFRLQIQLQRNCGLGERWWELKKYQIIAERDLERKAAEAKESADSKNAFNASEIAVEDQVKKRMGVFGYYGTPWRRPKVREQIKKIAAINAELMRQEEEENNGAKDG